MVLQSERIFSTLMSRAIRFCNKIIKETNGKIDQTDSILKTKLQKSEYEEIKKPLHQMKPRNKENSSST